MSRSAHRRAPRAALTLTVVSALLASAGLAHAQSPASGQAADRAEVERVRATTQALIESLVDSGLLPREKANAILKQAAEAGDKAAASAASADAPKPPVVRVPYISESVKAELKEQLRQDVLKQAHDERWGDPGAMPDWLRRIRLEGDVRVRFQKELFDKHNLAPDVADGYATQTSNGNTLGWAPDLVNTQHNRDRMTLRARLGLVSELGGGFSAGIRLTTGSTSGPTSVSQTLGATSTTSNGATGGGFNKYAAVWDRAYIQYQDESGAGLVAGRFGSPFFGTDLTWPDDLNFDGVAVSYKPAIGAADSLFMTAGAFPLREFEVSNQDKWLYGAQLGASLNLASYTQLRVGLAVYDFAGIQGVADDKLPVSGASVGVKPYLLTEYPVGVRQKGNTLIRLNRYDTSSATTWGLASKFLPINLTAELKLLSDYPVNVRLSADYVNNLGFHINEIQRRAMLPDDYLPAKQTAAYQFKAIVGHDQTDKLGQWQGTLALRRLERDAWVDAFTDTTWHLGGTNYQGWSIGGQYGLGHRTTAGVRWTSTRSLPDKKLYVSPSDPTKSGIDLSGVPLKIEVLQLELNARF